MNQDKAYSGYNLVVRPHISEKSISKNEKNKYVFEIYSDVNKIEAAKAIEALYGVKVEKVTRIKVPKKRTRYRNKKVYKARYDKVVVTLKKGQGIEVLPQ